MKSIDVCRRAPLHAAAANQALPAAGNTESSRYFASNQSSWSSAAKSRAKRRQLSWLGNTRTKSCGALTPPYQLQAGAATGGGMKITVQSDEGQTEGVRQVASLERGALQPETLGRDQKNRMLEESVGHVWPDPALPS